MSTKRRYRKFAWILGTSATVIGLLYWEQVAVLFVVSTLAMCALLLVVAFSNLEAQDKEPAGGTSENGRRGYRINKLHPTEQRGGITIQRSTGFSLFGRS
jgi:membrane protein implicated in regulation of membrane protease activity